MKHQNESQITRNGKSLSEPGNKKKLYVTDAKEFAFEGIIQDRLIKACEALQMDLPIWEQYHRQYEKTPESILMMYFSYIEQFHLNPLAQEIILTQNKEQLWLIMITVDGWAKYLNGHPQFVGITFDESQEEINHIPKWIECSIFRKDRNMPITIREYYVEAKTEHPTWIQMPRRMLRHRALTQCARLAFGIGNPECNTASNLNQKDMERPLNRPSLMSKSLEDQVDNEASVDFKKNTVAHQKRIEVLRAHLV